MRKIITLLCCCTLLMAACKPQKKGVTSQSEQTTSTSPTTSKESSFQLPAISDIAMYQVNPRVFAPDHSLNAVAARIDSISALGVNVMWVMPIYPIGVEKGKNSPYCIRDYKAIAPEFGTIEEFKNLVKVCHEHQMGIILDWVANHTAWDHPWVKAHPDWYTHDEKADTIIHPRPWEWYDVADLNYDNRDMREAMIDAMLFWVLECGVDGFRCDVADGVPADFWKTAIDRLRKAAGDRKIVMLAEGKNIDNFTVGGFDMNYGWDYKDSLVNVFCKGQSAENLIAADKAEYNGLPAGKVKLRFTTNHDHSTEVTPVKEFTNERGSMAAYVASVFPHGGALIYSSQEVGYEKPINFFQYIPVNWTAHTNLYKEYQHLIGLYNKYPALRKAIPNFYPDHNILLFEKADNKTHFLIAVNVRNQEREMTTPEELKNRNAVNIEDEKRITIPDVLKLKPFEYQILKLE